LLLVSRVHGAPAPEAPRAAAVATAVPAEAPQVQPRSEALAETTPPADVTPPVRPAPETPAPSAPAVPSAAPAAVTAAPHAAPRPRRPAARSADCSPPYEIDSLGIKRYKLQCL